MSVTKLPYGRPVKVLVDLQGFPDGRLVRFEVWRKKVQGEEKAAELYGSTNAGKAVAFWNPDFGERAVKLQETPTFEKVDEKYYFVAKVDDKEKKSQDFELTFPLILHFEDEEESLDDVKFTITFSDGSKRNGKFSKGIAEFSDAPLGEFKIEIKGYSPGVLYGVVKRK
jgi:hypothetical protein